MCKNGLADGISRSMIFMVTPTKIPSSTPIARHKTNVANVGIKSFPKYISNKHKIVNFYLLDHIKINKVVFTY